MQNYCVYGVLFNGVPARKITQYGVSVKEAFGYPVAKPLSILCEVRKKRIFGVYVISRELMLLQRCNNGKLFAGKYMKLLEKRITCLVNVIERCV